MLGSGISIFGDMAWYGMNWEMMEGDGGLNGTDLFFRSMLGREHGHDHAFCHSSKMRVGGIREGTRKVILK